MAMVRKQTPTGRGAGQIRGRSRREERGVEGTVQEVGGTSREAISPVVSSPSELIDLREDLIKLDFWREDDDMAGFTTEGYYIHEKPVSHEAGD